MGKARKIAKSYGRNYPGFDRREAFLRQPLVDSWTVRSFLDVASKVGNHSTLFRVAEVLKIEPPLAARILVRMWELGWIRPCRLRRTMSVKYDENDFPQMDWRGLLPKLTTEEADGVLAAVIARVEKECSDLPDFCFTRVGVAGSFMRGDQQEVGDLDIIVKVTDASGRVLGPVNLGFSDRKFEMDMALEKIKGRLLDVHPTDFAEACSLRIPIKWVWDKKRGFDPDWRKSVAYLPDGSEPGVEHYAFDGDGKRKDAGDREERRQEVLQEKEDGDRHAKKTIDSVTRILVQGFISFQDRPVPGMGALSSSMKRLDPFDAYHLGETCLLWNLLPECEMKARVYDGLQIHLSLFGLKMEDTKGAAGWAWHWCQNQDEFWDMVRVKRGISDGD